VKAAGVIKPAVLDRGGQATDPRVSALPNGGTDLGEARAALAKASRPTTADPETRKADTGPPPTVNGGDLQTRPAQAEVIRSPLAQDAPDQRSAPQTESAAPVEKAAAVKESQLQTFSGLMESVEKGGGEAKLPGAAGDTPLDTIAGSGPKGAPTPQSEPVNGVKADPAPPPQPVAKEEVIQQIVNSAKLRLNGGQSEMRIQLKPEHLGQVRLNISTDQHQVVVKVVAELPAVKELLETNLPQLRSELQGQGLEIDKFDVSVGGDAESQNKGQQTWGQRGSGGRKGAFAQAGREHQDQAADAESRPQPPASPAAKGVDYFA
jgi:flagellar hook-length control protein FliK